MLDDNQYSFHFHFVTFLFMFSQRTYSWENKNNLTNIKIPSISYIQGKFLICRTVKKVYEKEIIQKKYEIFWNWIWVLTVIFNVKLTQCVPIDTSFSVSKKAPESDSRIGIEDLDDKNLTAPD